MIPFSHGGLTSARVFRRLLLYPVCVLHESCDILQYLAQSPVCVFCVFLYALWMRPVCVLRIACVPSFVLRLHCVVCVCLCALFAHFGCLAGCLLCGSTCVLVAPGSVF